MAAPGGLRILLPSSSNAHWALGSVALLLLLLNLMTPALLSGISPSGGFLGEGTLYVSVSSQGALSFLIETEGHVELGRVVVAVNLSAPDPPGNATTYRHWDRWTNVSDVLAATFNVTTRSFVVNITAWYVNGSSGSSPGSPAATIGTFAFLLSGSGSTLSVVVTPLYPLVGTGSLPETAPSTWSASEFPISLPLAQPPESTTGETPAGAPADDGGPP